MLNKKYTFISLAIVAFIFIFIFYANDKAEANHNPNLLGWVWSSNIGWISMNGANCDADRNGFSDGAGSDCPPSGSRVPDYGVNQDSSGNLTGYGWSSWVGWISFQPGDLSGCPQTPCVAKVDLATGRLSGWGKFLNGSLTSGWDGWVRLSGTTGVGGPYGVTFDSSTKNYSGYSWGADVVGWMDWSKARLEGSRAPILASCRVDKSTADINENVTWTAQASGGNGTFTYLWSGSDPLSNKTSAVETVKYTTYGNKWGKVTVSSPGSQPITTDPCVNPVGGQGIEIQPTLTTGVLTAGAGSISVSGQQNSCTSTSCDYNVNADQTVTLTFTPSSGYVFVAWVDQSGNNTSLCSPTASTCSFNITTDTIVKAKTRKTQCTNGIDDPDPEDNLIDAADGGCHTDGNANNSSSYNPNDDNEGTGNQCSDGIDNSDPEDTIADACDPGCHADGVVDPNNCTIGYDPADTDETDVVFPTCNDHIDQRGDGLCDWNGCTINGVFLPADPSCNGNPYSNAEGDTGGGIEQ